MKKKLIFYFLLLIVVILYFYKDFISKIDYIKSTKNTFTISQLSIPFIKVDLTQKSAISDFSIWNIFIPQSSKEIQTEHGIIKKVYPKYEVKKFGKVEAIYKLGSPKDRWEFYGVIKKGKNSFAIFYNPSLKEKKWRLVKEGENIDENLTVKKIGSKNIIISYYKNENEKEELQLKVFYVEEEKFQKKEKNERSLNENKKVTP